MRISDWSSDVCSSDLAAQLAAFQGRVRPIDSQTVQPHRVLVAEAVGVGADDDTFLRLILTADIGIGQHKGSGHRVRDRDDRVGVGRPQDGSGLALYSEVAIVDEQIDRVVTKRSEEHTSELQSLMSTPYAVICLTQ